MELIYFYKSVNVFLKPNIVEIEVWLLQNLKIEFG